MHRVSARTVVSPGLVPHALLSPAVSSVPAKHPFRCASMLPPATYTPVLTLLHCLLLHLPPLLLLQADPGAGAGVEAALAAAAGGAHAGQ